jgi:hypothetical protein
MVKVVLCLKQFKRFTFESFDIIYFRKISKYLKIISVKAVKCQVK